MARQRQAQQLSARDAVLFLLLGSGAVLLGAAIIVVLMLYSESIDWNLGTLLSGRGGLQMPLGGVLVIAALFVVLLVAAGIGLVVAGIRGISRSRD